MVDCLCLAYRQAGVKRLLWADPARAQAGGIKVADVDIQVDFIRAGHILPILKI